MKYEATYVPAMFFEGFSPGYRRFELPTDEDAILYAEHPEVHAIPLKFVVPSEGTCHARIRKLVELTDPPRVVKEW